MENKISLIVEANYLHKSPTNLLIVFLIFILDISCSCHGFSMEFYTLSCPGAEYIVRDTVRSATSTDPSVPGKLLRLLFHDCFVEGCDASVLVEGSATERADPANASLGGFEVIETAKRELELFCPETVSCADIIALAARDAVVMEGQIFRFRQAEEMGWFLKSRTSGLILLTPSFTLDDMFKLFSSKGLSLADLVILSAHCTTFSDRFQVSTKGNLTSVDSLLDKDYASRLAKKCATSAKATVNIGSHNSLLIRHQYYNNLIAKRGLFQTDSILLDDQRTRNLVEQLASDSNDFYDGWSESFLKLSSIGVKTEAEGDVRQICSRITMPS
ncbi:Peroxidase 18 [Bienertia sinuspersici]